MDKVLGVLISLALVAALIYGWVWLVMGMLLVWVCMPLLSIVGGYFKPAKVKVEQ